MPFYDYRCNTCQTEQTLFYKSYADYDQATPHCESCGSNQMKRRIGRIAIAKGEAARINTLADKALAAGTDENDPRTIGRFMRQMSQDMGEDLGAEFNEVSDRLEKGQSPEQIEKELPAIKQEE